MIAGLFMTNNIETLINGAFSGSDKTLLRQHFESKIEHLELSMNQFLESYEMNFRTTNAILDGDFKLLDPISLLKLADFLNVTSDDILKECISVASQLQLDDSKKRTFILEHFNLLGLKKDGIINTTKDFAHIEKSLLRVFNLNNIYEYAKLDAATGLFSSTKIPLRDNRQKKTFKNKGVKICSLIENPNPYNELNLKSFFPRIRAYSKDIDNGMLKIIRELYRLGVTVIFHPSLTNTGARGLTIQSNGKPAIILTDLEKKYSTLWFALLHELYHVIFDWEDILAGRLHITDDDDFVSEKEIKANNFAREYMFPQARMESILSKIHDPFFVKNFAALSDVHYSIIYDNYCYDNPDDYPKYSKFIRTPWTRLQASIIGSLSHTNTAEDFANYYYHKIFNQN